MVLLCLRKINATDKSRQFEAMLTVYIQEVMLKEKSLSRLFLEFSLFLFCFLFLWKSLILFSFHSY